jgi:hypothetical protein
MGISLQSPLITKKGDRPMPINSKYPNFDVGLGIRLGDSGDKMPEGDFTTDSFALPETRRVGEEGQLI